METIVVSPKFHVMIPPRIRKACALRPGQEMRIVQYDNRIELILLKPMPTRRGFLKGLDTTIEREDDRV
ncbi:transcriptional regulator AbrB family [Candidatus Moduliflexus flocculans]|uniref:Transcriptional regulator AbrB family n=1 Tax=Candidatus Moduliflexus flocculans TaxID=1499966 RepID=A0A0S6W4R5_9BACT|nr:transcriptional regulator AbrB family [Candidatus Moduliflexus flocculans]